MWPNQDRRAVVGVNTSALIESAIVGRPVYSMLVDEFAGQQEGTLHFQHLKSANGGLLHVGSTLDEHLDQLAGAVHGTPDVARSQAFVEAFVRPHGLGVVAAERFADVIEAEAAAPAAAARPEPAWTGPLRVLLRPVATAVHARSRRRRSTKAAVDATRPAVPQ
jgi:hypothetical protein